MISFSGIDCGGKSTQIQLLSKYMTSHNIPHRVIWSRGGYTPMLEFFKSLIHHDHGNSHSKEAEDYRNKIYSSSFKSRLLLWLSIFDLSIYYGLYFRIIELFGVTIVADRYFWDSFIDFKLKYPSIHFEKWLIWKFAMCFYKKPKYSIIYTISPETSMYRSSLKSEPWPETIELRKNRIKMYQSQILLNRWSNVVNAEDSIDSVALKTKQILGYED